MNKTIEYLGKSEAMKAFEAQDIFINIYCR